MITSVAVFELLLLAAESPAATTGANDGTIIAVVAAGITALATVIAALSPTTLEIVKGRNARRNPTPPAPAPVPAPVLVGAGAAGSPPPPAVDNAINGLSMVEEAVMDYRAQRDDAMRRYYALGEELDRAQDIIREQAVIIARLEAASASQRNASYYGRHGMDGRPIDDRGHR